MDKITDKAKAGQLARAIASDIAIYNRDKIQRGIETDRLFEELADELKEADRNWKDRVAPEIVSNTNLLQKALIDTIFYGSAHIRSKIF